MKLTYLTKWPEEGLWAAVLAGLGGIITVFGPARFGWSAEETGAILTFVLGVGRLLLGAILPTPTVAEEVASVRESIDDKPVP